jgi:hypothetical protein
MQRGGGSLSGAVSILISHQAITQNLGPMEGRWVNATQARESSPELLVALRLCSPCAGQGADQSKPSPAFSHLQAYPFATF